jgi:hypothetical protein
MNTLKYIFVALFACSFAAAQAQGLQGIVVERYYQANAADVSDATTEGAIVPLTTSSVTYRVYVDMAAGYKFSQIYGSPTHSLTLSSTANFYNDPNWGVSIDPGTVTTTNIRKNTGMIDSWFTTGGTAVGKVGVRKTDDTDGSLGNAQSILANNPGDCFGAPINGSGSADGMVAAVANSYLEPNILGLGSALDVLDQTAGNSITITDGAIAALGGVVGATADNLVLIGQFTTTGSLSFALNVQLINISTGAAENYVASSPVAGELTSASLTQTVTPACAVVSSTNDSPNGATLVQSSPNAYYPNCYPITGTTTGTTDSPESSLTGPDRWYRFVALSTGVSITVTSSTNDDVIELYEKVGSNYVLMTGGTENSTSGIGDFEKLNFSGLTVGTTYYVSVGAISGGGTYQICIQHLMPSTCAYTEPAGGFNLCNNWKAIYRGAASNGVTYTFNFTGVGGNAATPFATTSLSGTNGLTTLSNANFGLRYGGEYDATVDVVYTLSPSTGSPEVVTVNGAATGNCNDVTIMTAPDLEIIASQRCPATLLRSTWLRAYRVVNTASVCGVTNYTYEFTSIANATACAGGTTNGLPTTFNTAGTSPYLQLGVLPSGVNQGVWDVRVRSNFGSGASAYSSTYGPTQRIQVNGTAASGELEFEVLHSERDEEMVEANASIYPNPSNGDMIAINFTDLTSNQVQVRLLDAMGREIFRSSYSVEGSLNQVITFDQTLAAGMYMVEMTDGTHVVSERMIVKN